MLNPQELIRKAQTSKFYLWLLNWLLWRMIPFNKPHRFKIVEINENSVTTKLPFRRNNLNHIKGLHACAFATISEFTTGVLLLTKLNPKKYRIILKSLTVDYHYQGKMHAFANFETDDNWLKSNVIEPLAENESTVVECKVSVDDEAGNHLTSASVHWQIKDWTKVKTKN